MGSWTWFFIMPVISTPIVLRRLVSGGFWSALANIIVVVGGSINRELILKINRARPLFFKKRFESFDAYVFYDSVHILVGGFLSSGFLKI